MTLSRRNFLKGSVATAIAANGLTLFPAGKVFASDTITIPSATHYGPFKAVVKGGTLIGVQPINDVDPFPTEMLTKGVLSRTQARPWPSPTERGRNRLTQPPAASRQALNL